MSQQKEESKAGLISNLSSEYSLQTIPTIKLFDKFLLFALYCGILQIVYMFLVGTYPYNAFLGGLICTVGFFVLTIALRLQFLHPTDFGNIKPESAFASYLACNIFLFFLVCTFVT